MSRPLCYFVAEMCTKGHQPDCPAIGLHQSAERYRAFYGEPKAVATHPFHAAREQATPMPSAEDDTQRHRAVTVGGYIGAGGAVVTYPNWVAAV